MREESSIPGDPLGLQMESARGLSTLLSDPATPEAAKGTVPEPATPNEDDGTQAVPSTWKPEPSRTGAGEARAAVERGPASGGLRKPALVLAALGLVLALVSLASAGFGGVAVHSVTLIVCGLALFLAGQERRALADLGRSLDAVGAETACIEQLATDGRTLQVTLDAVQAANASLTKDLNQLQERVVRLTEVVSNPDFTGSIFRLAASVDQLGRRLEVRMKEQFDALQVSSAAIAERTGRTEHQLAAGLERIGALLKEQHGIQHSSVREGFALLHTASDRTNARVDRSLESGARIEAGLQAQQETLTSACASLAERWARASSDVVADLKDLRAWIDRRIEGQATSLRADVAQIGERVGQAEREQGSRVRELGERLADENAARAQELERALRSIAEGAGSVRDTIVAEVRDLGERLAGESTARAQELERAMRSIAEGAGSVRDATVEALAGLGARGDEHARNLLDALREVQRNAAETAQVIERSLPASLGELGARLQHHIADHVAALRRASQEAQQAGAAVQHEIAASLERLGAHVERQGRDQLAAVQELSSGARQAAEPVRRELAAKLEQLVTSLEHQGQDQRLALRDTSQEVLAATGAARDEAARGLEQLRARLEETLARRCGDLERDVRRLGETLGAIEIEVRSRVTDAIPAPLDSGTELAATAVDLPPAPAGGPELEAPAASTSDANAREASAPVASSTETREPVVEPALPEPAGLPEGLWDPSRVELATSDPEVFPPVSGCDPSALPRFPGGA